MILRPVRPASAAGPPRNEPVGLTTAGGSCHAAPGTPAPHQARVNHVLLQLIRKPILQPQIMPGGDQYCPDERAYRYRHTNGYLGSAVRAQVALRRTYDLGQTEGEAMCQIDRKRHQRRVSSVA